MAKRDAFDATKLAALGAERLATILHELAGNDAAVKRMLKLELASADGPENVSSKIRKRLTAIGKARSYIDWHKNRALAEDLEAQRRAIVIHVVPKDPALASELLWQFMSLAASVYARCDDSNGTVGNVFALALEDLARAVAAEKPAAAALADKVFAGVVANDYGQFDDLIPMMAEPLAGEGLQRLRALFEAMVADPPKRVSHDERKAIGWSSRGAIYQDDLTISRHKRLAQSALTEIADALGDVDGYIARFSAEERTNPALAARIAERLLNAGRANEALDALNKAETSRRQGEYWPDWERVRIDVLDGLGLSEDAQSARWTLFETVLHPGYLKAYLKKLPDFDNDEAEEKALHHALDFRGFHHALAFLIEWPSLDKAAELILARHSELNGDNYGVLTEAAEQLETRHPLAATLALRAMIDFALDKARAKRYPHAVRHLATCADLALRITEYAPHPDHAAYEAALKARHGRKSGFWLA
ncbi:DUF6880 family protein [Rhabdaerophilum calidifontis]|uniref:DUF6880 family protein n=1 Tax=Rhabdaerophilum calidifontis TaxID=2604328 RepID=UPI00123B261B|nr:DUF6880 family protein [Rhabdaerophilum calidifontis]